MAMQTVEWDRSALMAPFVGAMAYGLTKCADYAKERRQFGKAIADYQAIKKKLADMKIFQEAARGLIYRIAWCKDQGRPLNHLEAAVAKLLEVDDFENARRVVGEYRDILGPDGFWLEMMDHRVAGWIDIQLPNGAWDHTLKLDGYDFDFHEYFTVADQRFGYLARKYLKSKAYEL